MTHFLSSNTLLSEKTRETTVRSTGEPICSIQNILMSWRFYSPPLQMQVSFHGFCHSPVDFHAHTLSRVMRHPYRRENDKGSLHIWRYYTMRLVDNFSTIWNGSMWTSAWLILGAEMISIPNHRDTFDTQYRYRGALIPAKYILSCWFLLACLAISRANGIGMITFQQISTVSHC